MKRACIIHDWTNLLCLPVLCVMALGGLLEVLDKKYFVYAMTIYVALDTVWVFAVTEAVPSARTAIKVHHIITLLLCSFPLRYAEVEVFACLDGLTEINTCFLIARRQFKSQRRILTAFYWSTFIPVRLVLFPYLLFVFASLPETIPAWERLTIWGCQAFLCVFNVGMTYRSLSGWWRNRQKQHVAAAAAPAGATKSAGAQQPQLPASATAHVVLATSSKLGNKGVSEAVDAAEVEQRRRSSRVAALEAAERSWREESNPLLASPGRHGLVSVRG